MAQNVTASGTIISADDSQPLPGVNVIVSGTTKGTVTDFDGKYSIQVPGNSSLLFSYIGFTTQTISVNGQSQNNVSMIQDAAAIDEVIVVDYGTQIKRQVTGSVQTVDLGSY